MRLYSTNKVSPTVGVEKAIFQGLPPDNGLYMPEFIPELPASFWANSDQMSFQEIAFQIANAFLGEEVSSHDLKEIILKSIDFEAPARKIDTDIYCLELFHGPSLAFKDFGARFMAELMSYFLAKKNRKIHILVATSGDTGGAVAQGFYNHSNIAVHILYPKGKVSEIQEKQLTTLGGNIEAIEIEGTFDDCQKLVKQAFLDKKLRDRFHLASANSINIARLIPQTFYFAYTYSRLKKNNLPLVFSVPSGNFGNLTAGVIAYKMGMPVEHFIASTNVNKVIPNYLQTGVFTPIEPSLDTISNAMDVGDPSNFPRLKELFDQDIDKIRQKIKGYSFSDKETEKVIKMIYEKYDYLVCPHTAVAYMGLMSYLKSKKSKVSGVFLSTAHFAKFLPDVERVLGNKLSIPDHLIKLQKRKKKSLLMSPDYEKFRGYLIENL